MSTPFCTNVPYDPTNTGGKTGLPPLSAGVEILKH